MLRNTNVRPFTPEDEAQLEAWKTVDENVLLETPHGFAGPRTETAVVERDGELLLSLTGNISAVLDPLIKNPKASRLDVMEGLFKAEAALAYVARQVGAMDIYISVPEEQTAYHNILKKCGYEEILAGCKVFKKALVKPIPLAVPEVVESGSTVEAPADEPATPAPADEESEEE